MVINEFDQYMLNGLLNKQFQELQKDGLKVDLGAVYNGMVLGYAVDAARRGDSGAVEDFVNSIGNVFFPTEGADDPMWPNAAKAAFKRSVFGLIDYYMEEDREMHVKAFYEQWNPDILAQRLDELWSHVTLYNVCQMMTQLASKASNDVDIIHIEEDDSSDEKDYLTLFFDATNALPTNNLRRAIQNQDNMLRAMAGSEKTIASVYGIVLTMMQFFTADSFDVCANQLYFIKMVCKRVLQARKVKDAIRSYKAVYHKTDDDISCLDSEEFAKTIMTAVNEMIAADSKLCMWQELRDAVSELDAAFEPDDIDEDVIVEPDGIVESDATVEPDATVEIIEPNDIVEPDDMDDIVDMESQFLLDDLDLSDDLEANAQVEPDLQKLLDEKGLILEKQYRKIYADHQVSHSDLANDRHALDNVIIRVYDELRESFAQDDNFVVDTNNNLLSADSSTTYIESIGDLLKDVLGEKTSVVDDLPPYEIKEAFIDFLLSRDTWVDLCHGKFDELVGRYYRDEIS